MRRVFFISCFFVVLTSVAFSQRSKVQAAWRSLSDYDETVKEGRPDVRYLQKANDAINAALENDETKKQAKTHAYKLRISYALFQNELAEQMKKLESTIGDKNERAMKAYGNADLKEFERAGDELNQIKDLDPAWLETISEGIAKGGGNIDEDEIKLATAIQHMKVESGNIASGKYSAGKYDQAADYFYRTAVMNTVLGKVKDTVNFYNACVAASKSGDRARVFDYNRKMIDAKIGTPYNYESIYHSQIAAGDSAAAIETLRKGRQAFPDDVALLTQETNLFLARGKSTDALENLKLAIQKDPKNALYHFIAGNLYDNLANPKDRKTGIDLVKPENVDELFKNAEQHYLKAIELNPGNNENLYNANYNLGAMYNNYGGYTANKKIEKITDLARYQKENEDKAQEYYKKAIPYLEKALEIKPGDTVTLTALRKLYMLTGDQKKAKDMNEKLKSGK